MFGYRLFRHAVLLLIDNLPAAARLSLLPFLGIGAASYFVLFFLSPSGQINNEGAVPWFVFGLIFAYATVFVWVAVGWHRYVLLGIEPGPAWPVWNGERNWAYVGAALRIVPLSFAFGLIAGVLFLIPAAVFYGGTVASNDGTILGFLLGIVLSYMALRLSLVLPAAAVGEFMRVIESWKKTNKHAKSVFVTALCFGVLTAIPNLLLLTPLAPILDSFVYTLVAQWFLLMLGISVLTALYGHIVEGRELR